MSTQAEFDPAVVALVNRCVAILDLLTISTSHEMLCKNLVHSPIFDGSILSAHLYSIQSNLVTKHEVGYGPLPGRDGREIRIGEDTFDLDLLETTSPQAVRGTQYDIVSVPLLRGPVPVAVLLLATVTGRRQGTVEIGLVKILQRAGSLFYSLMPKSELGLERRIAVDGASQLSPRHFEILQLMKQGLTNREIGLTLSLSESTIRQENIKIFRYLNVNTRQEAVSEASKNQ